MFFFLYATCVAAVLFDVGTSVPVPQFAPTCPSTHYLQNGACYLRIGIPVAQPCSTCQTAVVPMPPCLNAVPPCQVVYLSPTPQCVSQTTESYPPTTTPTTTTTTTTTPAPRPDPIIRCPIGTMLISGYCHVLYCGTGIYRDGKCIVTVCPDGTVWTGSKCEIPQPQNETTLNISNLVITNVNQTNVSHVVNYTSNINVYITESPEPETITNTPCPLLSTTLPPTNCCIIVTPRVCKWNSNRHICTNQKYRRCGSICTNENIYLNPPIVVEPPPPTPTPCMDDGCDYDREPFYPDCSICNNMSNDFCRTYCPRDICQERRCQSVELKSYCGSYPGAIGCRNTDGCTQDWCDGY